MEIDKDLRLPAMVHSWFQLAAMLKPADQAEYERRTTPPPVVSIYYEGKSRPDEKNDQVYEYFEGDEPTIKMRAFDEIKDLLPESRNDLIDMKERLLFFTERRGRRDMEDIYKLFDALIELY